MTFMRFASSLALVLAGLAWALTDMPLWLIGSLSGIFPLTFIVVASLKYLDDRGELYP